MHRLLKIPIIMFVLSALVLPVYGDTLTAQDIFEGMVYYENDQLEAFRHQDYHCVVTQTVVMAGSRDQRIMVKDVFFMVPVYQLDLYDQQPAHIFEPDAIVATLEIQDLEKLRDTTIDGIECYAIKLTPKEPAFRAYPSTHYVAKDDFRKVQTINWASSGEYLRVKKTLDYAYGEVDGMMLLDTIVAVTEDEDGNLLHTVTARYTEYEFDIGLTEAFFTEYANDGSVNPTYN